MNLSEKTMEIAELHPCGWGQLFLFLSVDKSLMLSMISVTSLISIIRQCFF